jgi:molecular chaperone HscA
VQINLLTDSDRARLLIASRAAKEALTIDDVATIDVIYRLNDQLNTINVTITRDQFDELSQTLLDRSMLPMKQALRDCGLEISAINEIIMVGGSTRMLSIRNQVSELFGRSLLTDIDPDRVVAIGAAIQADILVGNRRDDWLLLDVTPLSLGVETIGGLIEKIIPRNSTIPIARCQEFTTYKDGQTAMSIHVLQGERELVSDCKSLAKFSLKGIPPMVAGAAKIKITFQIDADGLLSVTAAEQTTGISSTIEVNPSFGLNETQIQAMLQASVINAKDDMMLRNLVEVETDSRALVDSIEAALVKDRSLLSDSEYKIIINAIDNVKNILDMRIGDSNSNNNPNDKNEDAYDITNNKNNIINEVNTKTLKLKDLNDKLNAATQDFAMRRMDLAVKSRLTGRSIKET